MPFSRVQRLPDCIASLEVIHAADNARHHLSLDVVVAGYSGVFRRSTSSHHDTTGHSVSNPGPHRYRCAASSRHVGSNTDADGNAPPNAVPNT